MRILTLRKMHVTTLLAALFLGGCGSDSASVSTPTPSPTSTGISTATTLDRAIVTTGTGTYKKLAYGPGWQRVLRTELADAQSGREGRRTQLLCVAHFSDVHIIDEESPLRTEFLRNLTGLFLPATEFQAAWRPQETLTTQVTEAMVRKINAIAAGPVSGRPYDCAVFTGDNGDNCHQSELSRFLTLMDGGTLTPKTGNPDLYEGVQDGQNPVLSEYWHPEANLSDTYKTQYKFPDYPGLLAAAIQPFQAVGLKTPFYTCYGNHDHLIQGNFPIRASTAPLNALSAIAQGSQKILSLPPFYQNLTQGIGVDLFLAAFLNPFTDTLPGLWTDFINSWFSGTTARTVTPDSTRQLLDPAGFVQAHLSDGATPGPVGHGFTQSNLQNGTLYYTFQPAPKVLGITLDTTNPGGLNNGSIDADQVAWMERQIQAVSSHYYDANGNLVTTGNADKLVVLCSHHSIETMTNSLPDIDHPQTRILGPAFETILHRYPNVVLWLNGHTHYCRIYPHPDTSNLTGGFWEVNSPSLIDYPQEARIVEMLDNQDGTLSIFGTMVDSAAEPETSNTVTNDTLSLASISRELSANDPQLVNQPLGLDFQLGQLSDRNVELIVKRPFTP